MNTERELLREARERIAESLPAGWEDCAGYTKDEDVIRRIDALLSQPAPEPVAFDDWPEYHDSAMGCGLEDRNITNRYEAMRYGWECAIDRVAERLPPLYAAPPSAKVPLMKAVGRVGADGEPRLYARVRAGTELYAIVRDAQGE